MKSAKDQVLAKASKKSAILKKIVSRFSRGNVKLQNGRYLTKEKQDARKQALKSYDFLTE